VYARSWHDPFYYALTPMQVLNLTGFRKALKKFQKVTGIPAQQPYMTEKVNTLTIFYGR